MNILRKVGKYELNEGFGMSSGLFNISNTELLETTLDKGVSSWFGKPTKDGLLNLSDEVFVEKIIEMEIYDINKYIL